MILKHSKPVAKAFMAYIGAIFYVAMLVLAIIGTIQKNIYFGIPIAVMAVILLICNNVFDWYLFAKIFEENGIIIYEVEEIIDMIGHSTTRYEIENIRKVKRGTKDVIVYGDIHVLEGLRRNKNKYVKSLKINNYTDEVIEMIDRLSSKSK